jgi:protein-S-isoprenylcysteine O-methyltransferase Ste14
MNLRTAVVGGGFLGAVFLAGPLTMIKLNPALGLPRVDDDAARACGAGLVAAAVALVLWCWVVVVRVGEGTPVPVEPPRRLVVAGPYRYSRNPNYLGYLIALVGLFLYRGEVALLAYAAFYAGMIHLWIVRYEEPGLRRRFGGPYGAYEERVPRWLPVRRAALTARPGL